MALTDTSWTPLTLDRSICIDRDIHSWCSLAGGLGRCGSTRWSGRRGAPTLKLTDAATSRHPRLPNTRTLGIPTVMFARIISKIWRNGSKAQIFLGGRLPLPERAWAPTAGPCDTCSLTNPARCRMTASSDLDCPLDILHIKHL